MSWRDNELAAQAADALGEPDKVHHLSPGRTIAMSVIAVVLVVWGLVGSVLWFVVLNAGAKGLKGYFVLVLLPAGIGLAMLFRLFRDRGFTLLTYPTGILVVQPGRQFFTLLWDEITDIRLGNSKEPVFETDDRGDVTACVLAGKNTAWVGGSNTLTITSDDERGGTIPVAIEGFTDLTVRVQRETFARLWAEAKQKFTTGQLLNFGIFLVDLTGISNGTKKLTWDEVGQCVCQGGKLVIRKASGLFKDWQNVPLENVRNPHILVTLVKAVKDRPEWMTEMSLIDP